MVTMFTILSNLLQSEILNIIFCRIDYDLGNAKVDEPVASNYYPINSWISMSNAEDGKSITILTDRSSGASSITDDSMEIMIHRRLQQSIPVSLAIIKI